LGLECAGGVIGGCSEVVVKYEILYFGFILVLAIISEKNLATGQPKRTCFTPSCIHRQQTYTTAIRG